MFLEEQVETHREEEEMEDEEEWGVNWSPPSGEDGHWGQKRPQSLNQEVLKVAQFGEDHDFCSCLTDVSCQNRSLEPGPVQLTHQRISRIPLKGHQHISLCCFWLCFPFL